MRTVYTIGHSTRTIEEFIALLTEQGIDLLVDIRRFPGSKRYPHFGKEQLPRHLKAAGIDYLHEEVFGGRRDPRPDSVHLAWRNPSFRAYADHMATAGFRAALDRVLADAGARRTAVMCAEAVPWRCHRNLISDALLARGAEVLHIMDAKTELHTLTRFAWIEDGEVRYGDPRTAGQQELFGGRRH